MATIGHSMSGRPTAAPWPSLGRRARPRGRPPSRRRRPALAGGRLQVTVTRDGHVSQASESGCGKANARFVLAGVGTLEAVSQCPPVPRTMTRPAGERHGHRDW